MTARPVDGFQEVTIMLRRPFVGPIDAVIDVGHGSLRSRSDFLGCLFSRQGSRIYPATPFFDGRLDRAFDASLCDHQHPLLLKHRVLYVRGDYAIRFDPSDSTQQVIRARIRLQLRRGNRLAICSLSGCCGAANWRSGMWFLHGLHTDA